MTLRLFASALASRDYFPLLRWMIFTGVTVFGFAIAWRYGLFQLMMAQDQTRISAFICILYAVISVHCLFAILAISREINSAHRVRERVGNGVNGYRIEGRRVFTDDGHPLPAGRITDYIGNLVVKAEKQGRERRLVGSILVKAQYYILDNASAYLFDLITDLTEVFVVSALERQIDGRQVDGRV